MLFTQLREERIFSYISYVRILSVSLLHHTFYLGLQKQFTILDYQIVSHIKILSATFDAKIGVA